MLPLLLDWGVVLLHAVGNTLLDILGLPRKEGLEPFHGVDLGAISKDLVRLGHTLRSLRVSSYSLPCSKFLNTIKELLIGWNLAQLSKERPWIVFHDVLESHDTLPALVIVFDLGLVFLQLRDVLLLSFFQTSCIAFLLSLRDHRLDAGMRKSILPA